MKEDLRDNIFKILSRREELQRQKENTTLVISGLEVEVKKIVNDKEELSLTWETLRDLLDRFSSESISIMKDMLNKGVKAIFTDRDYEINIQIADTKNKKLKLILVEHTDEGISEVEMGGGTLLLNGGGAVVVISFILQVFLITMYGKRKFICIDEGFTNISSNYVENFFRFLKYLHTEMGFNFMMINHDVRFLPYFDKTYMVTKGDVILKN